MSEEESGLLLREYLKEKQLTKSALTDIKFAGGELAVNGEPQTVRHVLSEGDRVTVLFPAEQPSPGLIAQKMPLEIVYEDDHCMVLNKPAGLPVIPSRLYPEGTLANGLLFHLKEQGLSSTIHIVNRLDKDTSGLMLAAKHRFSHSLFSKQQRMIGIHRTYWAIVENPLPNESGIIEKPIGRKAGSIVEREVREDGQHAVTSYRVISSKAQAALVELKLETGRTHQIRVHMSSIGHPLAGDTLYGGSSENMKRQALHSKVLEFRHPFLEKTMRFETVMPEDMKVYWSKVESPEPG